MSTPRKHHFISQFYLAGFTQSGTKDDKLFVFDMTTRRQWQSSVDDTACERDLYKLEQADGGDPAALEKFWSKIESESAKAIKFVIDNKRVPDGELFDSLIEFMSLLSARVPGMISALNDPLKQVGRMILDQVTQSEERWERVASDLRAKGHDTQDVTWEQMRKFVKSDDYTIELSQNHKMDSVLRTLPVIGQLLSLRKWSVVTTPPEGPFFVCSDRPLSLHWIGDGHGPFPPGFGLRGTAAFFPVCKSIGLMGLFEDSFHSYLAGSDDIARYNAMTLTHVTRFVYSDSAEFEVWAGGQRRSGPEWLRAGDTVGNP